MNDFLISNVLFTNKGKLGKGSFGTVYKVTLPQDSTEYALKVIENSEKEGIKSLKELDIMSRLEHPNITKAEMIVSDTYTKITKKKKKEKRKSRTGILMKLAETDLFTAMYDKTFPLEKRIDVLRQITEGLKFMHDSKYLHMDVKPVNILLFDNRSVAKLTDFGLALITGENGEKYFPIKLITVDHRPINIMLGDRTYTKADDIWSLGITFLEVLSGDNPLFSHFKKEDYTSEKVLEVYREKLSPENIIISLNQYLSSLPNPIKKEFVLLISRMLEFDPKRRITTDEILKSPSFAEKFILEGKRLQPPIYKPVFCNVLTYEGFDILLRISTRIAISLETFFLAVDIYQRSLAFRHDLTGDIKKDYYNTAYQAALSVYMAIKMIEPYFADPKQITELVGNLFPYDLLIKGESSLVNAWNGIMYPENFFTASTTKRRIQEAFELARDCRVYRYIDIIEWKRLSENEEKEEGKFDKYMPFISFLVTTPYYKNYTDITLSYIQPLYEKDGLRKI